MLKGLDQKKVDAGNHEVCVLLSAYKHVFTIPREILLDFYPVRELALKKKYNSPSQFRTFLRLRLVSNVLVVL